MEIKFNVTKERRKELVVAVAELTGWASVYKGAPSFAFAVNNYIIDRNGTIICDERTSAEVDVDSEKYAMRCFLLRIVLCKA